MVSPDELDTQAYPATLEEPVFREPEPLHDDGTASQMRRSFQHGDPPSMSSLPSATSLEPPEVVEPPEPPQEAS